MKQNKVSYSKSISWIDDCRIPFVDDKDKWVIDRDKEVIISNPQHSGRQDIKWKRDGLDNSNTQGRFPANILVSDDMLNDGKIGQNNSKNQEWGLNDDFKVNEYLVGLKKSGISRIADKGTNSRYYDIDKWFDKILND